MLSQILQASFREARNPLSAAKMSTQLVLRSLSKAASQEKLLVRVIQSLERADHMIQNLLDANRIKAGQKLSIQTFECDLKTIASDTLEDLALVHGHRFVLRSPAEVHGYWSCNGLRRVLENLCTNAVKYGSTDSPVTVVLKPEGARLLLSVHNFGPVIPKEQQATLFEPFQRATTAQDKQGWGLDLG